MANEVSSNVAIAPDSVATGAHNIRTVTTTPNTDSSLPTSEQQQVVTLAGEAGELVGVVGDSLRAADMKTHELLLAMLLRLDLLIGVIDAGYAPPDNLTSD